MLTETLIANLKADTTLLTLLDVIDPTTAPIQVTYVPINMPNKYIILNLTYGESFHLGYESGVLTIEVYVKDSINQPVAVLKNISERIFQIFDMKGSQLQDSMTTKVYRLRKVGFTDMYDNVTHYYIGSIDFEYFVTR